MRRLPSKYCQRVTLRDSIHADQLTVIMLISGEVFRTLTSYFDTKDYKLSRKLQVAFAVSLLIDFIVARGHEFSSVETRSAFFAGLASQVRWGSINNGEDKHGLWWPPRANIGGLINAILDFADFCALQHVARDVGVESGQPFETRIACWKIWSHHGGRQLRNPVQPPNFSRSHLLPRPAINNSRHTISADMTGPLAISDIDFDRLFRTGFIRPGSRIGDPISRRYNVRDLLYTLLLHGAGWRASEPPHVFLNDIVIDPQDDAVVQVRMFHPEDGKIAVRDPLTGATHEISRQEYLETHFQRQPLTQIGRATGFKPKNFPRFLPAFWYPRAFGVLFSYFLKVYLRECRPRSPLPWLFLTEAGLPLTAKAFHARHEQAVRYAGLTKARASGTTPHGHRHSFAQRLEDGKQHGLFQEKTIMICLHQSNISSQEIYTQPSINKITKQISEANNLIEQNYYGFDKLVA